MSGCLVRIVLLRYWWSVVIGGIFSWCLSNGTSLPFRYYLHLSINKHGIMVSRNVIANSFDRRSCHAAPQNAENLAVFLCKSSETGSSCFGTFHTVSAKLIGWFSSFPLLFNILALGLVDEKEVSCLRWFVMSSTSWHLLVEQHAHFLSYCWYDFDFIKRYRFNAFENSHNLVTHLTKETLMFT